ncbi:hypothetical protein COUCH_11520 [Couchioplanes caeruleus]|uniref:hypothetical protein n=1 Tax=Couchioplanes caeruleus TaxID=56438 RepID=UPI0020BD6D0D|nr:hypothetical protein [Couchioplanes caeruleus]UQU66851.1 hypothetical protein COUCH_11520 [Couchioplanes caeruleus]
MGLFDNVPPPPPPLELDPSPRAAWEKPLYSFGGALDVALVVARSDDAAVCVSELTAYPNGFEFTLTVMLREPELGAVMRPIHRAELQGLPIPDDFVRFGIQFSDGQSATNLDMTSHHWDETPSGLLLMPAGGGGSDMRYDVKQWVWPLPPAGPLAFVCEWPAQHIPETRVEIDAELIHRASARAVRLWPETGN